MGTRAWLRACLIALLVAGATAPLSAQSSTGSIQGVVVDEQGGIVPGASVAVRNVDTNAPRSMVTDVQGRYVSPNLPPRPIRGDGRAGRVRAPRPVGPHPGPEPGRRGRRPDEDGGDHGNGHRRGRRAPPEHHQRRGRRPLRHQAHRRAAGGEPARHVQPRPLRGRRQPDQHRPGQLRGGARLRHQRHAGAIQQLHDRRPGQQRSQRDRAPAADQQHRHRPGDPAHHQPVRRRVWPRRRLGDEHRHQERDQRLPRLRLLVPNRTSGTPGATWTRRRGGRKPRSASENQYGVTLGGPVSADKTFFFGSYQRWTDKALGSG